MAGSPEVNRETEGASECGVMADAQYDAAVRMALNACEATSPVNRFRLIETPNENFLLVTNVLPRDTPDGGETSVVADLGDVTDDIFDELEVPSVASKRENSYVPKSVDKIAYDGTMIHGSYIVYNKQHLERALALDKTALINDVMRYVEAPGVLDHNNVCDVESLLWLLFCGPMSLCRSERCLGMDKDGISAPFPVLLPPLFYEPVSDYLTYINLAELYVYVWYRDYCFKDDNGTRTSVNGSISETELERLEDTISAVRKRFDGRQVPIWSSSSRTCLFCTLYHQNRLCLDFATNDVSITSYNPILIKDSKCMVTNVTLGHVLPGQKSVSLFPVYNIGALLNTFRRTSSGSVTFQ